MASVIGENANLHFAYKEGRLKVLQTLLEHGADVAAKTGIMRSTMLHESWRATMRRYILM